ncbi:ribosomal protein L28e [Auriculariales sp. MPI-PUGE-AT-0066]|nr:ribosomal protein L28e [Auriculariales sp. MPI-PUGE-AT-0066]
MSTDLQWLLIRKYNSFLVKRLPEGPILSKEPGNLTNLHSHKYSGLANNKTIHIAPATSGVSVTTRKTSVHPSIVGKSSYKTTLRPRSGNRRVAGAISKGTASKGYRPDLRHAAVTRAHAILESQREKKDAPEKKVRGKKASAAAAAASSSA